MFRQFMQSDAGREFFGNGILPDGTVFWPAAGIGYSLRRAENALSKDGWTSVEAVAEWITMSEPEQQPRKYGCSSWRQVLHESPQFELRKRDVDGQCAAFYRSRAE